LTETAEVAEVAEPKV